MIVFDKLLYIREEGIRKYLRNKEWVNASDWVEVSNNHCNGRKVCAKWCEKITNKGCRHCSCDLTTQNNESVTATNYRFCPYCGKRMV